jgi:glycosyltransferase involved in cell wall biosynthesis
MSIVIFGDLFSFPDGSAATNRVYTYAKGFIENGIPVHVICFLDDYHQEHEGVINGIHYYHPFAQKKRNKSFIIRNSKKLLKFPNTISIIRKINKEGKIIAINSWSNLLSTQLFAKTLCRLTNSKLIVECSEHPLRFYQSGKLRKKQGELNFAIESSISDGVFCISHFLVDFYKSKGVDSSKLFLVPSTVDPNRFIDIKAKPVNYNYIGYFGSLTFDRDNVDLLINAFAEFSKQNMNIKLVLGGFCSDSQRKQIVNLIAELGIQERVVLLEYLTREQVTQYIIHASILVMVRSKDLQSQASYPSKLSEFLASSKPVISVNVGEIPMYLKDGEHAFLVEPGNTKALAEKLIYVWSNYELALQVGQKGRQLTETVFNYSYQAKRMIEFITSLNGDAAKKSVV